MSKESKPPHPAAIPSMALGIVLALGFALRGAIGANLFGKPNVPPPVTAPPPTAPPSATASPEANAANPGASATKSGGTGNRDGEIEGSALSANPFAGIVSVAVEGTPSSAPVPPRESIPPQGIPSLPKLPGWTGGPVAPAAVPSPVVPDLIGTLEGGDRPAAVLRVDGRSVVVPVGGTAGPWKVRNVRDGAVRLEAGGRSVRLTAPHGAASIQAGSVPRSENRPSGGTTALVDSRRMQDEGISLEPSGQVERDLDRAVHGGGLSHAITTTAVARAPMAESPDSQWDEMDIETVPADTRISESTPAVVSATGTALAEKGASSATIGGIPVRTVRFHDKLVEGSRIADAPVRPELPRRRVIFFDPVDPTKVPDRIKEATKDAAALKTAGTPAPAPEKQDAKPKDGKTSGDGA